MYTINIPISKEDYIFLMKIILEYENFKIIKELLSIEDEHFSEEKLYKILLKSVNVVFGNCIYSDKDKNEIDNKIIEQVKNNEIILEEICKKIGKSEELKNKREKIKKEMDEDEKNRIRRVKEYYKKHKK